MLFFTRRIDVSAKAEAAALRRIETSLVRLLRSLERCAARWGTRARPRGEREPVFALPPAPEPTKAARYLRSLDERFGHRPDDLDEPAGAAWEAFLCDGPALASLHRGDDVARGHAERAVAAGARVLVPASVLVDPRAWPAATAFADVVAIDEAIATEAARLVAHARVALPFDALLVACAPRGSRTAIMTGDPTGVRALARASAQPTPIVLGITRP